MPGGLGYSWFEVILTGEHVPEGIDLFGGGPRIHSAAPAWDHIARDDDELVELMMLGAL